jgi:hypothetical protein
MPITISPSPAVSPRVQMTAQQRACLAQIARRQTSPQRLVRRAKMLVARETGVPQCHGMRQRPLHRGTGQRWCKRWCALAPTLAQRETEEGRAQARTTMMVGALADHPRAGTPATLTAAPLVQMVAVAGEDPADSGRPGSQGTPREVAEAVRTRGLRETLSTRRVGRFLPSGGCAAPSGRVLAQRQAGCPRRVHRPSGGRVRRLSAGTRRGAGGGPGHQDGGKDRETSARACRCPLAEATRSGRTPCVGSPAPRDAGRERALRRGAWGSGGAHQRATPNGRRRCGAYGPPHRHRSGGAVAL